MVSSSMHWACHWGLMHSMEIDRRSLLRAASASAILAGFPGLTQARAGTRSHIALCGRMADGLDYAFIGSMDGTALKAIKLPDRGHGSVFSPSGKRVAFPARRPGTFCLIHDIDSDTEDRWLTSPAGRHFTGHGVFIDETTLATTENDFDAGRGVVGFWDTSTGVRIGEFYSHGIGPHDILPMQGGKALCIANGGILTHPDTGRAKLNIPTMQPNLSIIETGSGRMLDSVEAPPELHKVSLRHFAKTADDLVVVGGQFEGAQSDNPPLIATWKPGSPLFFVSIDDHDRRAMNHYCGSIAIEPSGNYAVATSPRGNVAHLIALEEQATLLDSVTLPDVCGAAAVAENAFVVTSGQGEALTLRIDADGIVHRDRMPLPRSTQWDNHAYSFL